jgi:hypothetical protein
MHSYTAYIRLQLLAVHQHHFTTDPCMVHTTDGAFCVSSCFHAAEGFAAVASLAAGGSLTLSVGDATGEK